MPYAYTRPSRERYQWQWYWDSCFAAIAWRRFDPDRSRRELETLLAAQRSDGFVGHTVFWHRPVSLGRLAFYNVASRRAPQTETIQPPLLAWAWRIAVGDPREEPRIAAQVDWLRANRDLEGDGLLWIAPARRVGPRRLAQVRPGLGPAGQRPARLPAPGRAQPPPRLRRAPRPRAGRPGPLRGAGQHALVALAAGPRGALGHARSRRAALGRAARPLRRLGRAQRPAPRPVTWAALAPLALPDLPEPIGHRLVETHLLNEREFLTPVAPPSVAANEPSYEPGGSAGTLRRYWRGPTWLNATWLLWLGLRRLGYEQVAARLAAGAIGAVEREGLREYYDPRTGAGLGAHDFAWSALVNELAAAD